MSEDGHLRGFINDIRADGTGIDGKLQSAMDSLAAVPFDDSIAEGPMLACNESLGILEEHAGHGWPQR